MDIPVKVKVDATVKRANPTYAALDSYDDAVSSGDLSAVVDAANELAERVRDDLKAGR